MKKKELQEKKPEVVYVLLSKEHKTFFISRGTKETLRETYRHHIKLRRYYSEIFVKSIAPERPCLFVLEEIDPEEKANLMIVWLRILLEHGYRSFNDEKLIEYAEYLYIDAQIAYDKRKDVDLTHLFDCVHCVVPTYNHEMCRNHPSFCERVTQKPKATPRKNDGKKMIRLRVTPEEAEHVRKKAKEYRMTVSEYMRLVAQNPLIIRYNYELVQEHTKRIEHNRTMMNNIAFTIEMMGNYTQRDIDAFVALMEDVYQSQIELLETVKKKIANGEKI